MGRNLSELWRARRLVAAVALIALIVGVATSYRIPSLHSRQYDAGISRSTALVDTRRSQMVDVVADGGEIATLTERAELLAELMTRSPIKDEIARRAGVPITELVVVRVMNAMQRRLALPSVSRATVREGEPAAKVLTVDVTDLVEGDSPIITVQTRAPAPAQAERLAGAAITALQAHLARTTRAERVPPDRQLVVRTLQPPQAATVRRGPRRLTGGLVAAAVLGLGCAGVLAAARLGGRLPGPLRA